jgi:hypothetical protein
VPVQQFQKNVHIQCVAYINWEHLRGADALEEGIRPRIELRISLLIN